MSNICFLIKEHAHLSNRMRVGLWGHTHTHTHTHTCIYTHTDFLDKSNFNKHEMVASQWTPSFIMIVHSRGWVNQVTFYLSQAGLHDFSYLACKITPSFSIGTTSLDSLKIFVRLDCTIRVFWLLSA